MEKQDNPLVSIICTAFNHESFITQCLDGFIMQQTNFPFEIIVHDDASTDITQEIIKKYEQKYPNLFNNIYQTENQYTKKDINIWSDIMFPKAKGKYIALCEGDDYWTDPYKLQKQVDFLEANEEYVFCGHEVFIKNTKWDEKIEDTFFSKAYNIITKNNYSSEELIAIKYPFHTSSFVFRNKLNWDDFNHIFKITISGDNTLIAILALYGKTKYFEDCMSVYRLNNSGISHNFKGEQLIKNLKNQILVYQLIDKYSKNIFFDSYNLAIIKTFDSIVNKRNLYKNKWEFIFDLVLFIFSNKFGRYSFIKKIKYSRFFFS